METVSIDFPRDLINIFKIREKEFPHKVRVTLSVELYREGLVSIGKAAEIAKVSIWEMQEILAEKKVPLNYYSEDLETDIKTLKKVLK
jgi:predicted HTH domain antitoxin